MLTRDQILATRPLLSELEGRGIQIIGGGNSRKAKCPFHDDGNASLSINVDEGLWKCFAGCGAGSVVDFIALSDGKPADAVFKEMAMEANKTQEAAPKVKPVIEKVYPYVDARGKELYQAVRLKPKDFRQRHKDAQGNWKWDMKDVTRVLYRLPAVMKSQEVWFVEGEKDADNLLELGYCGTCNVGGAKSWLDSYADSLEGKDLVICGDNDKPGQDLVDRVFIACQDKCKSVRTVKVPDPHKDVSDLIEADFASAKSILDGLRDAAQKHTKGGNLPLFTMSELEARYVDFTKRIGESVVDLSRWLPSLGKHIRPLVPGELVVIMADTGVGKTAILQNVCLTQLPIPTVMFEMELPGEMLFERFMAMRLGMSQAEVEQAYIKFGTTTDPKEMAEQFQNLVICDKAKLTPEKIQEYIDKSELKLGMRPKLVLIDYIQLMSGKGKDKYERISEAIEQLKIVAKETRTVIIVTSQVGRKDTNEIGLHDAKNSGSIEASSGLIIGAWRDEKDKSVMVMRVLKCTKGAAGSLTDIKCSFRGDRMQIKEVSPIDPQDYRQD